MAIGSVNQARGYLSAFGIDLGMHYFCFLVHLYPEGERHLRLSKLLASPPSPWPSLAKQVYSTTRGGSHNAYLLSLVVLLLVCP
jgi:hypothetical protein